MERFEVRREDDGVAVAEGELDLDSLGAVRAGLADPSITTIDLAGVTFIDSSVIGALVDAHRERQRDGGLCLQDPSDPVLRVLHLSGVDQWLPIKR